jgi:hypothetical protein
VSLEPVKPAVRTSTPRGGGRGVTIHVPSDDFGRDPDDDDEAGGAAPAADRGEATENGPAAAKKKTRRGSRGGRNRKKPAGAGVAAATNGAEPAEEAGLDDELQPVADDSSAEREPGPEPATLPALDTEPEPEPEKDVETVPEAAAVVATTDEADSEDGEWGYVPMSEWGDDLNPSR